MWIKRSEVENYVNKHFQDIKLGELFSLSKKIKIEVDKETIKKEILQKSRDEDLSQLEFYDKFVKALKTYADKVSFLSYFLEMIVGNVPFSQSSIDLIDITIDNEKVLISDVNRLLRPLKVNYDLMLDVKRKAENYETYLEEIKFVKPKSSILSMSAKPGLGEIPMTKAQMQKKAKETEERIKLISAQRYGLSD